MTIASPIARPIARLITSPLDGSGGGGPIVNRYAQFDGGMDRFLVFDSRLDDTAVRALMAGGNGPSGQALVRFELNEISGGKFLDLSGNGRDAVITGSPIITDF